MLLEVTRPHNGGNHDQFAQYKNKKALDRSGTAKHLPDIEEGKRKILSASQRTIGSTDSKIATSIRSMGARKMKDWRRGVIGRLEFSAQLGFKEEEIHEYELRQKRRRESLGIDDRSLLNFPISSSLGIGSTKSDKEFEFKTKQDLENQTTRQRMYITLEIEKCLDLHIPSLTTVSASLLFGQKLNPFVLIKLNGEEVGRTIPLQNTTEPVWFDETFEFPVCEYCDSITLEVWHAIQVSGTNIEVGDFLGKSSFHVKNFVANLTHTGGERFQDFCVDLKRWGKEVESTNDQMITCICPDIPTPEETHPKFRREMFHIKKPVGFQSLRHISIRSLDVEKPSNDFEKSEFKIENPHPYRRKDIRDFRIKKESTSFLESAMVKGFGLVAAYLIVAVIGFSLSFEKEWSVRQSIYFAVVTFTTTGYGDVSPKSLEGKLFSCFFAMLGVGIIGIVLGFVGQNIVQASVKELERKSLGEDHADDGSKENTQAVVSETRISHLIECAKSLFHFFVPIILTVVIGSVVVGVVEGWSWSDSFYWCIMTGTSVGYGDYFPTTDATIWFCIFYIPISVGVLSAALGRIANIFVEKEIEKANTKMLKREVTIADLEAMNSDGDGEVSPLEFVEHMLLVMNKVDQRLLDELHAQFEKLDADGSGGLQQDDLEILTRQKLQECRLKRLSLYKGDVLPSFHDSIDMMTETERQRQINGLIDSEHNDQASDESTIDANIPLRSRSEKVVRIASSPQVVPSRSVSM